MIFRRSVRIIVTICLLQTVTSCNNSCDDCGDSTIIRYTLINRLPTPLEVKIYGSEVNALNLNGGDTSVTWESIFDPVASSYFEVVFGGSTLLSGYSDYADSLDIEVMDTTIRFIRSNDSSFDAVSIFDFSKYEFNERVSYYEVDSVKLGL